jgi:hypothetical protein
MAKPSSLINAANRIPIISIVNKDRRWLPSLAQVMDATVRHLLGFGACSGDFRAVQTHPRAKIFALMSAQSA